MGLPFAFSLRPFLGISGRAVLGCCQSRFRKVDKPTARRGACEIEGVSNFRQGVYIGLHAMQKERQPPYGAGAFLAGRYEGGHKLRHKPRKG